MFLAASSLAIGMLLLFVGCTSPSSPNDQGMETQGDIQQPATDNGQTAAQNPETQPQGGDQQTGQPQGPGGQQGRGPRGELGTQFMEACSGKAVGDACTLSFRNQSVDGKCTDRNGNMTCVTNNASTGQRPAGFQGGGAAFVQACQGKAVGDACTLTMRNQTVVGTCADTEGNITCTPNNRNLDQRPQTQE
jgi:hypothetical protein